MDAAAGVGFERCRLVALWLAGGARISLWMFTGISKYSLAEASGHDVGGAGHGVRTAAVEPRHGVALPASLRSDGLGSVCYIRCFSRESLRTFCRPVPARSGHRVRSRL